MSTDYIVFRSVGEFTRFVESMVKGLTEAESVIKGAVSRGDFINAIDVESMVNVALDPRDLLNIIREAKDSYQRILRSIPGELKDAELVVILEIMGNKPVKAYIIPLSLRQAAETGSSRPASVS
ncbi:MAG: hypothetical protein RXQ74_07460 [Caldivirga sp.]